MGDNARRSHRRRLFVKDGHPVRFFLHQSIQHQSQRQKLRADIEAYGGHVASTDDRVDTVLISATHDQHILRLRYGADPDKHKRSIHVERLSFVQHCIKHNHFEHRVPIVKGMGGQIGQRRAVEFTLSDDENLCGYIARVQPCKEAGGRSGNKLYEDLVKLGDTYPEHYSWTRRHTFHSWRERYKKNQQIFDPIIERIAKAEGTYDKPLWKEDRRMSRRRLRTGRHSEHEDSSDEEYEAQDEEEEEDQLRGVQEAEEGELSPQPEEGHDWEGDEYGQEFEIPQDGVLEDPQVPDVDLEIKKRKRSHPGAVLDQVAKKRRSNISASYPAKAKEKEIAHESDQGSDGDNEMANTSLFSIDMNEEVPLGKFENDEPGPSTILRSPERSLVDLPLRSDHQHMNLTQETLVNTQSRVAFEPASHPTSANRRYSGHTSRTQPISSIKDDQDLESLPRPQPAQHPSPVQLVIPFNPTATNQPESRGPKPRPKQKATSAIVKPGDAPYRNTRARSRSVELVAMQPPTFRAARRRKQKSGEETPKEALTGPTPITETIEEEEMDKHILMTKDAKGTVVRARDPSLETDDAQTRQSLRPASETVSARPSEGTTVRLNRNNASDILDKFHSTISTISTISQRYSAPFFQRLPTQNDPALDENRRPRWSEPQLGIGTLELREPRTPMNERRSRQESTSSTGSFPLKGTRASAAKKKRQEQEKYNPYHPPEGTRAAQFARSR